MNTSGPRYVGMGYADAFPELLEALRDIIDQACVNGCPEYQDRESGDCRVEHTDACVSARAAIAKAEGR